MQNKLPYINLKKIETCIIWCAKAGHKIIFMWCRLLCNWCRFLELWGMIKMNFYLFPSSPTQYNISLNLLNFHVLLKAKFEVASVMQKRYPNSVRGRKLDISHILCEYISFTYFKIFCSLFYFHAFIWSFLPWIHIGFKTHKVL